MKKNFLLLIGSTGLLFANIINKNYTADVFNNYNLSISFVSSKIKSHYYYNNVEILNDNGSNSNIVGFHLSLKKLLTNKLSFFINSKFLKGSSVLNSSFSYPANNNTSIKTNFPVKEENNIKDINFGFSYKINFFNKRIGLKPFISLGYFDYKNDYNLFLQKTISDNDDIEGFDETYSIYDESSNDNIESFDETYSIYDESSVSKEYQWFYGKLGSEINFNLSNQFNLLFGADYKMALDPKLSYSYNSETYDDFLDTSKSSYSNIYKLGKTHGYDIWTNFTIGFNKHKTNGLEIGYRISYWRAKEGHDNLENNAATFVWNQPMSLKMYSYAFNIGYFIKF